MFSLRSSSAISNICLGRLKVKVTLEGQMIKWSYIELVPAISFMLHSRRVHVYVLAHPHRVHGFLGSVFAFRSISWQL